MMRVFRLICLLLLALFLQEKLAKAQDLSTLLMNSTFEIAGPGAVPGEETSGTIFILGKPEKNDSNQLYYVLVTAAHVLDGITGDQATLLLRQKQKDGTFQALPYQISIRNNGQPLYVKNPDADVAVMYIKLPSIATLDLLPMSLLADDAVIDRLEIHPGDELECLGFPLAISLNTFPVIRSGLIASYPLTPTEVVGKFYYNFHVFPGNSGGPVYFSFLNRVYGGTTHLGDIEQGVIGLVDQEVSSKMPAFANTPLDISIIIPSTYITDTIKILPDEPSL